VDISVQSLTSVDKEIIIKANREELEPKFDAAIKKYQGKINLPGFRPGKVPAGIVKKRFGKEIEFEEINSYINEIFEKEIVPKHEPVGESQLLDLKWEDDLLEAKFKIGAKPEFELKDLKKIKIDKMVHDVSEKEVNEEIERTLEREGNWEDVEEVITENHRVVIDALTLDKKGNPVEGEKDENQVIDLRQEAAAEFKKALKGKKIGDQVDMKVGEKGEKDHFRVTVKKVQTLHKPELTDEFVEKQSQGQAKNEDEFRSYIKSSMQQYYDQTSDEMFRREAVEVLVKEHKVEIPEVFEEQVLNSYVDYLKQQQSKGMPADFDEEEYKDSMRDRAKEEGSWYFINLKLQEKFEDIEIKPEDIDAFLSAEAARYGATVDQMKGYYAQNPGLLENLRGSIRENKVFEKLEDAVTINELSKEDFRKKKEKNK
jgi:trigger factor